jgi:3-methyladenine DNA glycosylase AlkD
MPSIETILEIISKIRQHMNGDTANSMRQMGIIYPINYGVSVTDLKTIAIPYAGNHPLALALFEQDIRECKILASIIDDPKQVSGEQIDKWSNDFKNIEIVEQVCSNLFWKADSSLSRSIEWCLGDNPLLIKAGLIIAMRKATDANTKDAVFEPYFEIIENLPDENEMDFTGYAVGALRQIAARNHSLKEKALKTSMNLANSPSAVKAWIGNQLLFELT